MCVHVSLAHMWEFLWIYLDGELLGYTHMSSFIRGCQMVLQFTCLPVVGESSCVPHVTFSSFRIFSFLTIWLFQNPVSCYFICISLTTREVEHFFIYWLAIKIESVIWFFTDLLHFSNGLCMFSFFPSCFIGVHTYKPHIVSVCGSISDCFWCLLYYRKFKMWSYSLISW